MASFANAGLFNPVFGAGSIGVATTGEGPPSTGLAGFHGVLQFSARLLQAQIEQSLGQLDLSGSVPWGSIPLPASVIALIPPLVRMNLAVRGARLELRLTEPYIASLHWPTSITVGTGGVAVSTFLVGLLGDHRVANIG
jgi:hypothetical protein